MAENSNERELREKIWALADKRVGGHDPASVKKLFLMYDSNSDGLLSRDETYALLDDADVGNFATRGYWVDGIFDKLDKSPNDNRLSWEEYAASTGVTTTPSTPGTTSSTPGTQEPGWGTDCDWESATCDPNRPRTEPASAGSAIGWALPAAIAVGMVWLLTRD